MNIAGKTINGLLNFILPNTCLGCENILDSGDSYLCPSCFSALEKYNETHPWQREKISEGIIDNSFSVYWFREGTPIQQIFHALKYQKMKRVGIMLGEEIGKSLLRPDNPGFDLIIPVPLHKAKQRDRTYNQSEFIAEGISRQLNLPVIKYGVKRNRFTPSQTKLNKEKRKENVKGAFEVQNETKLLLTGKNIILCDDVITTGATILECARALKNAGAAKVWACSAAYAELKLNVV